MFTLAQVSATFVAIISGFYTSKLISISGEKRQLANKMAEFDASIENSDKLIAANQEVVNRIEDNRARKRVDSLIEELAFNGITPSSSDDLATKYRNILKEEPSKRAAEIMNREFSKIVAAIQQEHLKYVAAAGEPSVSLPSFEAMKVETNITAGRRDTEENELKRAEEELTKEKIIRAGLDSLRTQHQLEYDAVVFPPLIQFGYIIQAIFAATGIIFPMMYQNWTTLHPVLVEYANIIAIIAFCVGLVLTLTYIGWEVRMALRPHSLIKRKDSRNGK